MIAGLKFKHCHLKLLGASVHRNKKMWNIGQILKQVDVMNYHLAVKN